jgi:hypothetical protein
MKKLLLFLCLSAACSLTLSAAPAPQSDGKNISVTDTEVVRIDAATVSVAFKLETGSEVTARNRSLIVRPALVGTGGRSELPPIIIRGARAKASAESRAMDAAGVDPEGRYVAANGSVSDYYTLVPWQEWMAGSKLVLSGLNAGKGDATEVNIGMVADNLLPGDTYYAPAYAAQTPPVQQAPVYQAPVQQAPVAQAPVYQAPAQPVPPVQQPSRVWSAPQNDRQVVVQRPLEPNYQDQGAVIQRSMPSNTPTRDYSPVKGYYDMPGRQHSIGTIGDEFAARFTFVEPVARFNSAREASSIDVVFDYNMPLVYGTGAMQEDSDVSRFVEMTREGAVYFKFERGSSAMARDLGENNTMHVDLISTIRILDASPDTRISQIVVVGFSAPEGQLDEKETLAMERAGVTRDFLTANSRVNPDIISTYNGSVDWVTLRALVSESNMPEKYKVLEIMDNVPTWTSSRRHSRLGRLMELNDGEVFNYMRRNFFPQLRQTGAYVKVYYENVR